MLHRSTSDIDTDNALGLSDAGETEDAQEEVQRLQQEQLKEQKRQIDRQITDPIHPLNN